MSVLRGHTSRPRFWRVFFAPILIGLLVLTGLLSGLSSGSFGRYFSWLSVGSPLAVNLWIHLRRVLAVVPDK